MNLDPYTLLGVAHDASDETVTKAYKQLAKKYHPDLNPGNQDAAKKMSEINAAYDLIKSGKANEAYRNAYGTKVNNPRPAYQGSAYDPFAGSYRQTSSSNDPFEGFDPFEWIFGAYANQRRQNSFETVINAINRGDYEAALATLNNMSNHNAKWHYLSGIVHYGMGNREEAVNHAKMAVEMEPDNDEYQSVLLQIQKAKRGFGRRPSSFSLVGTIVKLFLGFYAIQFLFSVFGLMF